MPQANLNPLSPLLLKYLQFFDFCSVNDKPYGCDLLMKSRFACCPGIDVQKVQLFIVHYLEDMGMS